MSTLTRLRRKHGKQRQMKSREFVRDELGRFAGTGGGGVIGTDVGLSSDERKEVRGYAGDGHEEINYWLRKGASHSTYREDVLIDAAIEKSITTGELVVYRRSFPPSGKSFSEGVEFTDLGYTSTSSSEDILESSKAGMNLTIKVPAGIGALDLNSNKASGRPYENEILLQRGLRYRVESVDGKNVVLSVVK